MIILWNFLFDMVPAESCSCLAFCCSSHSSCLSGKLTPLNSLPQLCNIQTLYFYRIMSAGNSSEMDSGLAIHVKWQEAAVTFHLLLPPSPRLARQTALSRQPVINCHCHSHFISKISSVHQQGISVDMSWEYLFRTQDKEYLVRELGKQVN